MKNIYVNDLRKDIYGISQNILNKGAIYNVSCKTGNINMISKKEYDSLLETLYLSSNPEVKKSILEGMAAKQEDILKEEDVVF